MMTTVIMTVGTTLQGQGNAPLPEFFF